eukprot:Anaeramoba_flamelloidesc42822_g1_i1.p2 GENE.c42822_g1_i1~~c42822_g1_i1.p2  ORF type:complete len:437 (-),score=70.38 c42822_g1_i1:2006-3316(-)
MDEEQKDQNTFDRVAGNDPTLTVVKLNMSKTSADERVISLIESLKKNTTITELDFFSTQITDKGMKALSEFLKVNQTITFLDLHYNLIGDEGMQALSEALKVNKTLRILTLSCNKFGQEGMKSLSEALKVNQAITHLRLSENNIKGEGMKALCEALEKNQTVILLDLSENKIKEEGSKSLREALKKNHSLTRLNLSRNKIGSKGAKNLGEALKENKTLCSLDLDSCKIGYYYNNTTKEKNVQDFLKSVKSNKSLIKLHIGGSNKVDFDEVFLGCDNLAERNLNFQKKLTKSVQEGNLQLFKELIQIEKIPLINQSSELFPRVHLADSEILNGENTAFHTAIFHNQAEILFHLLFANNEKTDQEIISKRNLLVKIKCPKTKKSVLDLLNPNDILIKDFKNYYDQFISTSSSSSSSLSSLSSLFSSSSESEYSSSESS